jgi:hypothetical protein
VFGAIGIEFFTIQKNLAFVGTGDGGNHADQGGFASAIRAKQAKNASFVYIKADVINGGVFIVTFYDVLY